MLTARLLPHSLLLTPFAGNGVFGEMYGIPRVIRGRIQLGTVAANRGQISTVEHTAIVFVLANEIIPEESILEFLHPVSGATIKSTVKKVEIMVGSFTVSHQELYIQ